MKPRPLLLYPSRLDTYMIMSWVSHSWFKCRNILYAITDSKLLVYKEWIGPSCRHINSHVVHTYMGT